MKKRLLSNRVRNAILMAILLQSVIFGIGLMVTGTFSGTANRPYKVMESQVAEKDALISGYMNNSLRIANTMEKELAKLKDDRKIHDLSLIHILLKPSLVSCALFQFMWTNNDFQCPLIYIADMQKYTNSVYLRMSMDGDVGFQWNRIPVSYTHLDVYKRQGLCYIQF